MTPSSYASTATEQNYNKPNCIATTGIIFLSIGIIMIVWGVTSASGNIVFERNPLLIAGVAFFGSGCLAIVALSAIQRMSRGRDQQVIGATRRSAMRGHDSPAFEVDEPPNYRDCFILDATPQTAFPSPELLQTLKGINDLPSYQDLFGTKEQGPSNKP